MPNTRDDSAPAHSSSTFESSVSGELNSGESLSDSNFSVQSAGLTDVGLEREENQDCISVNPELGVYLVLDGMGGHQGGATASRIGCEVAAEVMQHGLASGRAHGELLVDAAKQAGARIHVDANRHSELHGMGTTFVGVVFANPQLAYIAHVGDSRAYLMRDHRLSRLTEDHTVVAELVALGKLTPAQAHNHPHSSVLSRNLGGLHTTNVDLSELHLKPFDRILLCSDGLNGYATQGDIEKIVDGAILPENASADLVELAKRGGGGDNVSVIIIDVGRHNQSSNSNSDTERLRRDGAQAWWKRRKLFLRVCSDMGLAESSIAAGLDKSEAISLLAGSYCEAVYHDLNNTSGVHVWTFADSLVTAWLGKSSSYPPLRELFDTLRAASLAVCEDLSQEDQDFGVCLEIAVLRSLVVGEMVIGSQMSTRIQKLSAEIAATAPSTELPDATFSGNPTIPFGDFEARSQPLSDLSDDVALALETSLSETKAALSLDHNPYLAIVLSAANESALDHNGKQEMSGTARELYGNHLLGESELNTIVAALDKARVAQLSEIRRAPTTDSGAQRTAFYLLSSAHQILFHALAMIVIEAGKPTSDRLQELQQETERLRLRVSRNQDILAHDVDIDTVEEPSP
ncbi:MAG: protein phosphatase 2C domain-containing protein [Kofleriaceae bacterium]|nr:protein phosphatase 2C domain-containing protein [Kofleriaceae bacterium]